MLKEIFKICPEPLNPNLIPSSCSQFYLPPEPPQNPFHMSCHDRARGLSSFTPGPNIENMMLNLACSIQNAYKAYLYDWDDAPTTKKFKKKNIGTSGVTSRLTSNLPFTPE